MHYEKASAELITFVNGCFIMTGHGSGTSSDDNHEKNSSEENGFVRHYFAARNRH